jgi:hypothetical protein
MTTWSRPTFTSLRNSCAQPVQRPAAGRAVRRPHSCSAPRQPQRHPPRTPARSARMPPLSWPPSQRRSPGPLPPSCLLQPPAGGTAGRSAGRWALGPAERIGTCPDPPCSCQPGGGTCGERAHWPVWKRSTLEAEASVCCPAQWGVGHCCSRRRRCHRCPLGTACCCGGGRSGRADGSGCRPCCCGGGRGSCWRCGVGCGTVCAGCGNGCDPNVGPWCGIGMGHSWGRTCDCAEDGWGPGSASGWVNRCNGGCFSFCCRLGGCGSCHACSRARVGDHCR